MNKKQELNLKIREFIKEEKELINQAKQELMKKKNILIKKFNEQNRSDIGKIAINNQNERIRIELIRIEKTFFGDWDIEYFGSKLTKQNKERKRRSTESFWFSNLKEIIEVSK